MPILYDTHAHLDDPCFATDLDAVLKRAVAAGVVGINTIGIDLATSRAATVLAERYALLAAVVGIQPNSVAQAAPGDWEAIVHLADHPTVVAIGETGLDRYWDRAPFALQEDYFRRHLALCRVKRLPIVIHCREAEADLVRVLRDAGRGESIDGVMHSFSGDPATAEACLALGLHISFAGMVTYKKNDALRAVAAIVPLDRLLIETDAPYLSPEPMRGMKRNEPANVAHTAACLAKLFTLTPDELADATTRNAQRLFTRRTSP